MQKSDLVTTRDYMEDDKNFILATFLRGLYYGDTGWIKEIPKQIFMENYHAVVEKLLASGVSVKVACLKDDVEVILGYSIYKGDRLDWVFVKKAWRGIGIAKQLLPQEIKTVTHLTNTGRGWLYKHPGVIFNPFTLGQ